MGWKKRGEFDEAQDRLFAEIFRCQVLNAQADEVAKWLDDTVEYLAQEYPALTEDDVRALRQAGENFVAPPIPHGAGLDATNRDEWA